MSQLDAIRLADAVKRRLASFACSENHVRDERLSRIIENIWYGHPDQGGLVSDLWVEGAFPALSSSTTLDDLARCGLFSRWLADHLDSCGAFPRYRTLYTHQAETLEAARYQGSSEERPALVVTAPTGSGKTEAFLLPLLNDLYQQPSNGQPGIKCLILYPMNALVNDQVDRLYGWLKGQRKVSLFHFTSETPEDKDAADREGVPKWDSCRFRTRQQARGYEDAHGRKLDHRGPVPDIVITNYSMLEYMLCRPQDAAFFGPALRCVVLDEAHLYTGTLAAEITLLLRRLYARCGVKSSNVFQIATSATLGTGSVGELHSFASVLFSKPSELVKVVQGKSSRIELAPPSHPASEPSYVSIAEQLDLDRPLVRQDGGNQELVKDREVCQQLKDPLTLLVSDTQVESSMERAGDQPACLLYEALSAAPIMRRIQDLLWERKRLPLQEVAHELFGNSKGEAVRATAILLNLGASSRRKPSDYPLIPHRIHLLCRPIDSLCVCLNERCTGPSDRKLNPLGAVVSGNTDRCPYCGGAMLSLHRCDQCGDWFLGGTKVGASYRPAPASGRSIYFTLRDTNNQLRVVDPMTGEVSGAGAVGVRLYEVDGCHHCGADLDKVHHFNSGAPLTLSILAETLLSQLPEYASQATAWLPARGRRLLAFSDSRQEAARLGPRLTRQHELQLTRRVIVDCLNDEPLGDDSYRLMLQEDIDDLKQKLADPRLADPHLQGRRRQLEKEMREKQQHLQALTTGGSMKDWAEKLASHVGLVERLDPDTAKTHDPTKWNQSDWEMNGSQVRARASHYLGEEFIRGISPLERNGLAEITYPALSALEVPATFLGNIGREGERQAIAKCWADFVASLCDTLRAEGAITLGSDQADNDFAYIGRWCAEQLEGPSYNLVSFLGRTDRQSRRKFAAAVLCACGLQEPEAQTRSLDMLHYAFQQLVDYANTGTLPWLQVARRQTAQGREVTAIRLIFNSLGLRRPPQLFRCDTTGRIFPRSAQGCGPMTGCDRGLHPVTHEEMDTDPQVGRTRTGFLSESAFAIGLWAEEHSAQLAAKENRRLQDLFKAGIRNILSATTTLELGIDIGGLSAVLMANVPPGKANYLQRAGRAGRRADGSSIVVTFARTRPFDQEVFRNFGEYLDRPLRRPLVFLDRNRLVRRHLHSLLLGLFFQQVYPEGTHVGAMSAFGRMGEFIGLPLPPRWGRSTHVKPRLDDSATAYYPQPVPSWWNRTMSTPGLEKQFLNYLQCLTASGQVQLEAVICELFRQTGMEGAHETWNELLRRVITDFSEAVQGWRSEYDNLLSSWQMADSREQANAIRYQLFALHDLTVIEALADRQFLPHYGFPIGVQKLRIITPDEDNPRRIREEDQYRLERSSLLALREYVPGSQLLVGGKLVTSHGLLKHWTGANIDTYIGLRGEFTECVNGHFYYWTSASPIACPICGGAPAQSTGHLLFPKHGFSGAAWDPPRFGTDVERVGSTETTTITFSQPTAGNPLYREESFGGIQGFVAQYKEDGELLVYNKGDNGRGFALCLKCGFAESEDKIDQGKMNLPSGFAEHSPLTSTRWSHRCWNEGETPILRNQVLAAREITDVLLLDFTQCLGASKQDEALVTTIGYALQRAGASILELDSRELGVMVVPAGEGGSGLGVVLYDNVPGGAGHVRELLYYGREWINAARNMMYVSEKHHQVCETACLECLLSYDAQEAMSRQLLNRRAAIAFLDRVLTPHDSPSEPAVPSSLTVKFMERSPSVEERLARALERRRKRNK